MIAGSLTKTAGNTPRLADIQFLFRLQSLGIVAPHASKGAPLEEHRVADTAAVVEGKLLDVKDQALHDYTEYL